MSPKPYNPCADGFAAKAWECLRRNEKFLAYCDDYLEAKSEDDAETATQWYFSDDTHPFHRAVLGHLVGFDPLRCGDELARLWPGNSWRELKVEIQADFESALSWNNACRMPTPDWPVINPFKPQTTTSYYSGQKLLTSSIRSYSADAHRKCLEQLEEQSLTHHFIAVPKVVWTPRHRKEIELQVGELLNKPIGNVKWIKPSGGTLGSKALWAAYLLFEEWTKAGYGRGRACGLVAWEKYEAKSVRQDFGQTPKARKQAAADFLATSIGKKQPEKKDTVEGHVASIEKAIKSVFPLFVPFYCKQKKQ